MEEFVPDSPIKGPKLDQSQASKSYNSESDDGDDHFADYETVQTVLLNNQSLSSTLRSQRLPSPSQRLTQPTQLIDRSTTSKPEPSNPKHSVVQVAASSPLRAPPVASPPAAVHRAGGILARSMAPPGTTFRNPNMVSRPAKPQVIDISDDDGPIHRDSSSDEDPETRRRGDIRPTKFTKGGRPTMDKVEESPVKDNPRARFNAITSNSMYQPPPKGSSGSSLTGSVYDSRNRNDSSSKIKLPSNQLSPPSKRSADAMANAYGSSRPEKRPRQSGPARAQPVQMLPEQDKSLDDVQDWTIRDGVVIIKERIDVTVLAAENALILRRGNVDDAMEYLLSYQDQPSKSIDLTLSEDELGGQATKQKVPARQQVKAPIRSIQEKWSSTQTIPKELPKPATKSSPLTTPKKPRKRLMRGRKHSSSPVASPVLPSPQPSVNSNEPQSGNQSPTALSSGSDSAASEPEPEVGANDQVLNYINTCTSKELADLTSVKKADADLILSHRPFKSLADIESIRVGATKTKNGKNTRGRAIGERIVEKCHDMWSGYEAVDTLVKECEALGQPIVDEMKKWGVNIFGKEELDLTDLQDLTSKNLDGTLNQSGLITPADEDSDAAVKSRLRNLTKNTGFIRQPSLMSESVTLKDYQIVGINWLSLLFRKKLSCMLADDMGLGKTCQVVGFLAHLKEIGVSGPHLVVVPPATLENWLREFSIFCPKLKVEPYYGSIAERPDIRFKIETNDDIDIVVTTYTMAKQKEDHKWLRRRSFCACVFDEGHMLKNSKSEAYNQLIRIPAKFRLLLTGTPLQNNLIELISLLAFIMPQLFRERRDDLEFIFSHKIKTSDENHDALLSAQRVTRAKSMLKPFVLRRKKHQVLPSMPKKTRRVEYCELNPKQAEIYHGELEAVKKIIEANLAAGKKAGAGKNIMMRLRHAAIHPLLFRRLYNDELLYQISAECLKIEQWVDSNPDLIFEDMTEMNDTEIHRMCEDNPRLNQFALQNDEWLDSGKVTKLVELLLKFKDNGDRTLVFSQFTLVLNILDYVLETLGIRSFRLDGSTKVEERQDMIDEFYDDSDISVFMLSTKAGGTGINLACANKVIIFDMSFNPQDDIQAENRAHRVGSVRDVEVIRLVTKGTIEEQIFKMGESKVMLDERVAGVDDVAEDKKTSKEKEEAGMAMVSEMLVKKLREGADDETGAKRQVETKLKKDAEHGDFLKEGLEETAAEDGDNSKRRAGYPLTRRTS
jgi:SWI/SNF-related matrix-associated actin-dependent regulator 1 of chromatin subfamily A